MISKECAAIRTAFKDEDTEFRHRNVAKMLFIHMLGYSTHFGHMECLKLIATNRFSEKRIGYLALMLLLDEKQEVLMLVTNSLQMDLQDKNHFTVALALCALANISDENMCRDLCPYVEKLLKSQNPYIRKKAALATVRIVKKQPEMVENFIDNLPGMLNDRDHAVLLAAVTLIIEVCQQEEFVDYFRQCVGTLVRILKNLVMSGYAPEHDISGLTDPFLQCKVLRLLRLLGRDDPDSSDRMADILAQVVTNTEIAKNAGHAIVYECVMTIMGVEAESGLRTLAINILGRFLLNRDNNIRYVALHTLGHVVLQDVHSVQRHRGTIVECLKDPDSSIRQRAQHLVYSLVNKDNVRVLVRELVDYLEEAEPAQKGELAQKICVCADKFAPNKKWQIDTVIKVLELSGNDLKDETAVLLLTLIAANPDLYGYAVAKLFASAKENVILQPLGQICLWCIGEYGELLVSGEGTTEEDEVATAGESDALDLIQRFLRMNTSTDQTKESAVTALVKLSARFSDTTRVQQLLAVYQRSVSLELQQRACEFGVLADMVQVRASVLERMPPVDLDQVRKAKERRALGSDEEYESEEDEQYDDRDDDRGEQYNGGAQRSEPAPAAPAPAAGPVDDLLGDLLGPAAAAAAPSGGGGGDLLGDLLGGGGAAAAPVAAATPSGGFAPIVAYKGKGIQIKMDFAKPPGKPNMTAVTATCITNGQVTDFTMQAAVPKYIKLQLLPASGTSMPPTITQVIRLANQMHGEKPIQMKLKLSYTYNGNPVSELAAVSNMPTGL